MSLVFKLGFKGRQPFVSFCTVSAVVALAWGAMSSVFKLGFKGRQPFVSFCAVSAEPMRYFKNITLREAKRKITCVE